jgi:putative endopeptidase
MTRLLLLLVGIMLFWARLLPSPAVAQGQEESSRYGAWGLDTSAVDKAMKPGDSFFGYANGVWNERTQIPADRSFITLRLLMSDTTTKRVHGILEDAARNSSHEPRDLEGKVGAFYKAFMDEGRLESLGARPLEETLTAVRKAATREAVCRLIGRGTFDLEGSLFGVSVDVDPKNAARYAVTLTQSGLGLPDRDYYLDVAFAAEKAEYLSYVERLLRLIGWRDPVASARRIVRLEDRIATVSWSRVAARELDKTYNPMTIQQLERLAPGFHWRAFLDGAKLSGAKRVIVSEKSAFPKIAAVFADTPVETLRAWLAFRVANNAAPYLSKAFVDESFGMYGRTIGDQREQQPRWKLGVRAVAGAIHATDDEPLGSMRWAVGQLYVNRYFDASAKAQVEDIVANLLAAFRARIQRVDWMSMKTRSEALRKLDTYNVKIGYPSTQRDYSHVVIRDDDLLGNVRRAAEAEWEFYAKRLSGPVDLDDWGMTPQTNDAYNGSLRDIVIPAGVLQPPMFDPRADPAVNYGAIGAYIGHEITHGFDDQGRKIDAKGMLRDWWTAKDAGAFAERATRLAAQYSAFEPLKGVRVNGRLTLGENIADLGGVAVALEAYRASLKGRPAPELDGWSSEQRFFLGWAQAWRGKVNEKFLRNQVISDLHSPRQYRVDGVVRNIDEWYEAFGVKEGEKLYVAPAERVRIW